jgi:aminoglycoside 3-N-acetyltransferase
MNVDRISIANCFKSIGIFPNDTVMIHGDAGVATQLTHIDRNQRLQELISQIIDYFTPEGTIVVPTFSYSFTKNEDYDVNNSPSDIGRFSETFRKYPLVGRSNHPIFSVAGLGKNFEKFKKSRVDDCFGEGTAFDLLYKMKGKIICLGCDFGKITFIHYVEQYFGVPYRYMKNFNGFVIQNEAKIQLVTSYYARKLDINSVSDLTFLKRELINQGKLLTTNIGKFSVLATKTDDFFNYAIQLMKSNKFALIKDKI